MLERKKLTIKKAATQEELGRRKQTGQPVRGQLKAAGESAEPEVDLLSGLSPEEHSALLINASSEGKRAEVVMQLQRTYGNAYVQRLLDSRVVQAKLTVSNPGDPYETEAERVADAVMNTLGSPVTSKESQTRLSDRIERQEEEEELQTQMQRQEEEEVQTEPLSQRGAPETVSQDDTDLEERINDARSSGGQLDVKVRKPMEQAFQADFSGVRIHTDANADNLNRTLQARAFTTKQDIFFKEGNYQPGSENGRRLIAHELTHVVQQSGTAPDIERVNEKKGVALPLAPKQSAEVPDLTELTDTRVKMKIQAGKKQEAIDLILAEVKSTKLPMVDQLVGKTVKYDKDEPDIGGLYYTYDPQTNKATNVGISIGDAAFSSVSWLYSTMGHEHRHAIQMFTDPKKWDEKGPLSEFVAWSWEILHSSETGVFKYPEKMKELGAGLKSEGWDQMSILEKGFNIITYNKALNIVKTATAAKK